MSSVIEMRPRRAGVRKDAGEAMAIKTGGKMRKLLVTLGLIATVAGGCSGVAWAADRDPTLVQTRQGAVKGALDGDLVVFKGIPYAAPPIGPLRWRPPQSPPKIEGVLEATKFGPSCPFLDVSKIRQGKYLTGPGYDIIIGVPDSPENSEDCLHLNVWAPVDANRAAVMVWIQPTGSSAQPIFDGAALARQGVVMVTLDYPRLTLSNFAHPALIREAKPDEPLSSFEIMDQMAALRWVKDNIEAFGGDPRNVTVFGVSAGGAATLRLLTIPSARGLIDKAIVESGVGWWSPFSLKEVETLSVWAAKEAGLPGADATADQLRALNPDAMPKIGVYGIDGRFQPENATTAIAQGRMFDVPLMIGWNDFDGSSLRSMPPAAFAEQASASLKAVYASEGKTGEDLGYQMYTDQHVGAPARWIAHKASGGAPSYLYLFSFVPKAIRGKVRGAGHSDEVPYVFGTWGKAYPQIQLGEEERATVRLMQSCWVSFAKTGKPTCEGAPAWPRYRRASDQLMELGVQPKVLTGFRKTQLDAQEAAMQDVIDDARKSAEDIVRRAESGQLTKGD